jgi:BirA family biotin operon repressor/biotin-[acetyl-CoA-carboxylase] ligase
LAADGVSFPLICGASRLNFILGLNYDIYRFGKIDSTNSQLMKLGEEGFPEGTVVVADEQTMGRGRFGRRWEAEPHSNLLFSILLRPVPLRPEEMFVLTFAAAVAVAEAVEDAAKVHPELVWPNDLFIDGKKACGILLETNHSSLREGPDTSKYVVLGVGLNVNQKRFPSEIETRATSLFLSTGKRYECDELLLLILDRFSRLYDMALTKNFYEVMKRWRDRSRIFDREIRLTLSGVVVEGICRDVSDDGAIVVQTAKGFERFTAGEVTIMKL